MRKMNYCKKCVYPFATVNLNVDDDGVCSACKSSESFSELDPGFWEHREKKFKKLISRYLKNNGSNYDCLIPVSGGKDSFYQTHLMAKEYGLKPLLMTYHGNNFLPEGDFNRDLM